MFFWGDVSKNLVITWNFSKNLDFGRRKTKHDTKSLRFSCRVLFFSCQNLDFFSKFLVRTRFFSTSPQKTRYFHNKKIFLATTTTLFSSPLVLNCQVEFVECFKIWVHKWAIKNEIFLWLIFFFDISNIVRNKNEDFKLGPVIWKFDCCFVGQSDVIANLRSIAFHSSSDSVGELYFHISMDSRLIIGRKK